MSSCNKVQVKLCKVAEAKAEMEVNAHLAPDAQTRMPCRDEMSASDLVQAVPLGPEASDAHVLW